MREMEKLHIEHVGIDNVKPYENNARHHEEEDLSAIRESIEALGFNDPIGVWGEDNIIVEGHGRWMVMKEMGETEIPVIHLDHMSDEERRAYALAHNKTAELSSWDPDILGKEIQNIVTIDMTKFGFDGEAPELGGELEDDKYTMKIMIPQYEITGECPTIDEMLDMGKAGEVMYCCHKPYQVVGHIMDADILEKKRKAGTDMEMCDIPCRMTAPNMFVSQLGQKRENDCFI